MNARWPEHQALRRLSRGPLFQIFVAVGLMGQVPFAKADERRRIFVGILDDDRLTEVGREPGNMPAPRVIRPAFETTATGWHLLRASSLPKKMTWTIAFDGKSLGQIEAEVGAEHRLTPVQAILTRPERVPEVGIPSMKFAGLCMPARMRRPLVVVSQPNFRDPDGWKPLTLPKEVTAAVRKAYRGKFPRIPRCRDEKVVEERWDFPDSAMTFPASYGSNKHTFLVEVDLAAGDCGYVSQ